LTIGDGSDTGFTVATGIEVTEADALGDTDGFLVALTFTVGLTVGFADEVGLGDAVLELLGVAVAEAVGVGEAVGVAVDTVLAVGLGDGDSSANTVDPLRTKKVKTKNIKADFLNMQLW
jgi:hypothetical protein